MSIISVRSDLFFFFTVVFIAIVAVSDAFAHTMRPAIATLELEQTGTLNIQIKANAEALLVGLGPEHADTDDAPNAVAYNDLRALSSAQLTEAFEAFAPDFTDAVIIESDMGNVQLVFDQIIVPQPGDLDLARDSMIELSGRVSPDSTQLVWRWPERYGSSVVRLYRPGSEVPETLWLQPGEGSNGLQITGSFEPPSAVVVVRDYIILGFTHILPLGLDHILFVLGLFLLSTQLRPLLWQVSAFTLAHTITLGLSIVGLISLPSNVVEPLIALSIVYVGVENCLSSKLKPWRIALVFAFGLLHGIGFAGVLGELGLPDGAFLTALISFNVGVELGQFAVICLALLVVGLFRQRSWYRGAVVVPGSLAIAFTGLYWTWERVLA